MVCSTVLPPPPQESLHDTEHGLLLPVSSPREAGLCRDRLPQPVQSFLQGGGRPVKQKTSGRGLLCSLSGPFWAASFRIRWESRRRLLVGSRNPDRLFP